MKNSKVPFYLLAVAIYPVLFLFSNNLEYLQPVDLIRSLLVSLILILALYAVLSQLFGSQRKGAILAALLWALFSVYGHVYQALHGLPGLVGMLGKHSILGLIFVVFSAALVVVMMRSNRDLSNLSTYLNAVSGVLLVLVIGTIFINSLHLSRAAAPSPSLTNGSKRNYLALGSIVEEKPDVYYIILDTYSRKDIIQKVTGLDTTPFLDGLRQRGFYVADHSFSNYDFTRVSLASSLNMDYIPNLDTRFVPSNPDNAILDDYILHSKVRATFEKLGYQTVAFETGFGFTEMKDAGEYLAPGQPSLLTPEVQPFESLWMKTTGMRALFDTRPSFLQPLLSFLSFPHARHVERELFVLDRLPKVAQEPGPKFVFAHLLIPHVPFVFRADGSINKDDRYFREMFDQPTSDEYMVDGYRNQVEYINQRLLAIIDQILKNSAKPPVIILQGDHGLLYSDHNPILNAYYFPPKARKALYPGISPVNTFRVLLGTSFGADLPLLPDRAFSSAYTTPYNFREVDPPDPPQ